MNRNTKSLLFGIAVLFLGLAAMWHISGASFAGVAKQFILKTAAGNINGSLSIGEFDFSFSGSMIARQVELKDPAGELLASAQVLSLDLDLSDLLSHRLDISRIRKISVEDLVLNIKRDKDSRWNATETLNKPSIETASPSAIFRGLFVVNNATVSISTTDGRYGFKQVSGILDFASYPDIAMNLKSKTGSAEMAAHGVWNFSEGGNVSVNAQGVDPGALSPNIRLKGAVTSTFVVAGTSKNPTAKGSFRIPSGSLGNMAFSEAAGNFSLSGATLSFSETRLNAFGGSISASGPLSIDTLRYSQTLAGQNIDSSQLSDQDVQGRLQFTAGVEGQESWENANADGSFSMGPGSVSGIPFETLTGNFAKRGRYTRYYNLKATIAGQTVYLGDAESLNAIKSLFKMPALPTLPTPALPKPPVVPSLPQVPTLPRVF